MRNSNISRRDRAKSKRQAPANYLIICEGKKTEPNYFNGLKKKINEKYGDKVDVFIPSIEVKGTGMNTVSLVKYAQKIVNYASKIYAKVWIVFDKDDYSDEQFESAVKKCECCEYNALWSNPNFEVWLLAHFKKVGGCISKENVLKELSIEFRKRDLGEYNKNDVNIFEKVTQRADMYDAVKNCKHMEKLNKDCSVSKRNPMTKVYKIIEELEEYLK